MINNSEIPADLSRLSESTEDLSLLGCGTNLGLLGTSDLLHSVLLLLSKLSRDGALSGESSSDESVLGLVLLQSGQVVVDQTESSAARASKLGAEAVDNDGLGVIDLVELGKSLLDVGLGDAG